MQSRELTGSISVSWQHMPRLNLLCQDSTFNSWFWFVVDSHALPTGPTLRLPEGRKSAFSYTASWFLLRTMSSDLTLQPCTTRGLRQEEHVRVGGQICSSVLCRLSCAIDY